MNLRVKVVTLTKKNLDSDNLIEKRDLDVDKTEINGVKAEEKSCIRK